MNLKYSKLHFPGIYKSVAEIEIKELDRYLETLKTGFLDITEDKKKELSKDYVQNDWELQEVLSEELSELEEVFVYGEIFLIIGLYRIVELNRKKIFLRYIENINKRDLSRIDKVKKIFNNNTNKQFDKLSKSDSINELRLLNNCLKHSERVSSQLADYDGWVEDEEIKSVKDKFHELKESVPEYIYDLAESLDEINN